MLKERLQILIDAGQRRRLDAEARRRGVSVGAVVRDAIDTRLGDGGRERKAAAAERLIAGTAEFIPAEEIERILDERHDEKHRRLGLDRDRR